MRFSSLIHVPTETRKILRDRFDSFLRTQHGWHQQQKSTILEDEQILQLLRLSEIRFNRDATIARAYYEELQKQPEDTPSFDELIESGWIRVICGRVSTLEHLAFNAIKLVSGNKQHAIMALLDRLGEWYDIHYSFLSELENIPVLNQIASQIEQGDIDLKQIGCFCPQWVAARLWDRHQVNSENTIEVQWWRDRWGFLGDPVFAPSRVWDVSNAKHFTESILALLNEDKSILSWDDFRNLAVKQSCLITGHPIGYTSRGAVFGF